MTDLASRPVATRPYPVQVVERMRLEAHTHGAEHSGAVSEKIINILEPDETSGSDARFR